MMRKRDEICHALVSLFITRPAILLGRVLNARSKNWDTRTQIEKAVLVVLVEHLGDLIINAGFFEDLRQAFPDHKVVLVTDERFKDYAQKCPYIDTVLGFRVEESKYLRAIYGPWQALKFARKYLRQRRFQFSFNSRWDVDHTHSSLIALFSGADQRIGFSEAANPRKKVINAGLDGAFTVLVQDVSVKHDGSRGSQLLRSLGIAANGCSGEVWMSGRERDVAERLFAGSDHFVVALGVGASQEKRKWPVDRYIQFASRILEKAPDTLFLIVGNEGDRLVGERIYARIGSALMNLASQTTIGESAALLKRCDLYIGSDSGPMHMAAAVGVPVVEISCHPESGAPEHPNSPDRYYPLNVPSVILRPKSFSFPCSYACSSDKAHCILSVTVNDVVASTLRLMVNSPKNQKATQSLATPEASL
jgi:heptosyltransferase-2